MGPKDKHPVLIFEVGTLGSLQVYHYQTEEEILRSVPYKDIYWSDPRLNMAFGPFPSISSAMAHYTAYITKTRSPAIPEFSNVVHVDFKTKKKL